jgi:hypothetical protein
VAVPIEAVGIFGRNIAATDMPRAAFAKAPTWSQGADQPIAPSQTIKIALARH